MKVDLSLDLDLVRFLVAVIDGGSVAEAARLLQSSRPTVRRKLADLEDRAGTPLLFRGGDRLVATEAGDILVRRGRELVSEVGALLEQAKVVGESPGGEVRIAHPPGPPPSHATLFVRMLRALLPNLRYRLLPTPKPHEALLDDADLAVTIQREVPPGPWTVLELGRIREWLVASPEYLDRQGVPEGPADLADHDILVWQSPEGDSEQLPLKDGAMLSVVPTVSSCDIYVLRQMARFGLGIAYVPDAELRLPDEPAGALVPVLPELIGGYRPMRLLTPTALRDTPRTRAVVGALEQVFGQPSRQGGATRR